MRNSEMIDTRDLVDEIEKLETIDAEDFDEEDRARLKAIRDLFDEIEGYAGDAPKDGIQLIADSYFKDYARELADDLGSSGSFVEWPHNHIDWEAAAEELKGDYNSVEFDGVTYWYR